MSEALQAACGRRLSRELRAQPPPEPDLWPIDHERLCRLLAAMAGIRRLADGGGGRGRPGARGWGGGGGGTHPGFGYPLQNGPRELWLSTWSKLEKKGGGGGTLSTLKGGF